MSYTQYLEEFFNLLVDFLVDLGEPAEQGQFAAMVGIYLGLTLLVLLLVFLVLRRRRKTLAARREEAPATTGEELAAAAAEPEAEAPSAETQAAPAVEAEPQPAVEAEPKPEPPVAVPGEEVAEVGLFQRLRQGLSRTRSSLLGRFDTLFEGHARLDEDFLEELEEILITADFGMQATQELVQALTARMQKLDTVDAEGLYRLLREEIRARLQKTPAGDWPAVGSGPLVIMVVGVNGVGKTTTIGKLAKQFTDRGQKVVLGAGDTFRAAASQQLQVWGERSGATVICHAEGSDPAAVAFDAAKAAVARNADVLIIDTAGRLHTKVNLMEELKKVRRVIAREIPGAPHETLLVLDATTGQNALIQAKIFQEAVEVSGIALTKLDGTAKGGIVVAIGTQLGLPVRFIGVGEGVSDLRPFVANEFVEALFADS